MESWLNDALTSKDDAAGADEPPIELLQQGAAGLHGLQNYGLARADLKARGLSAKSIQRVYRAMYGTKP
jgi:acyl-[acyl carrier protein]--UDP-N-acetylglucosamine O-acyltransferase